VIKRSTPSRSISMMFDNSGRNGLSPPRTYALPGASKKRGLEKAPVLIKQEK
jgi:hypothetical protein